MITSQAVGNLVIDPKFFIFKDNFKIVETRIAVSKSKDRSVFIDVKFKNNKAGEILLQHAKKGSSVSIWGELDEETWGEGDGKRSKIVLVADGFRFLGGKPEGKSESSTKTKQDNKSSSSSFDADDVPF